MTLLDAVQTPVSAVTNLLGKWYGTIRANLSKGAEDVSKWTIVGASNEIIRRLLNIMIERIVNMITVTVEIDADNAAYQWLVEWAANLPSVEKARLLCAKTNYKRDGKPEIILVPGKGTNFFTHHRRLMWISRENVRTKGDVIRLVSLGRNNTAVQEILDEAMRYSNKRQIGLVVYVIASNNWEAFGDARQPRPSNTLILPEGVYDHTFQDCKHFLENPAWFKKRGIPYRRGVLLYGEPGSGKSTFVEVLCGALGLNICLINLAHENMSDQLLLTLLNKAPPGAVLLLEDIDTVACARNRDSSQASGHSGGRQARLSFSGLLNALDGVIGQEGKLLFMTTNKIDVLDPALIREGRIDRRIHFDNATKDQARRLFIQFYTVDSIPAPPPLLHSPVSPSAVPPETRNTQFEESTLQAMAVKFSEAIPECIISMASIQGFLLRYVDNPVAAVENVQQLVNKFHNKVHNE